MTEDKWQRVKDVFWAAHELPVGEREAYARAQCAGDETEVLSDVLGMLRGDAQAESSFLSSPMPASTKDLQLPTLPRRLGNYELIEELGRGGMGVVFRARQDGLDRDVAVKLLPAEFTLDERLVKRFQREARAIGKLRHPGIVPVYDVGVVNHEHYFVMELVDGHDLYHELRRLRGDEPGEHFLPKPGSHDYLTAVVQLVTKVARSLAYAHDNGVVHRDIKPRNLIVERVEGHATPRAAVLDFGLARDSAQGLHSLSHEIAGTPHYMSPEQIDAKRAGVDQRTDLYSLGVVLYELLTLTHPFQGATNLEVMQQISARAPATPRSLNPRVPRDLETVCLKAIEKRPVDRYPDMDAFADDLRRFLDHEAVHASRPSLRTRSARHLRRHRRSYVAATAGALLIALIGAIAWALDNVARVELLREQVRVHSSAELSELSVGVLQEHERHARVLASLVDPDGEAGIEATAALARIDAHVDALIREGRELVDLELRPPGDPQKVLPQDWRFHAGLQLLSRASTLRPSDTRLARESRAEHYLPTVEIVLDDRLRAADAEGRLRVLYATYDWRGPGMLRDLEGWRAGPLPLAAGEYRFRVELAGGGIWEATHWIRERGRNYTLAPEVRAHDEVIAGMVHIPAGTSLVGRAGDERFAWVAPHERHIDEFWIDRDEVTNAEYRAFLRAVGRPAHWMWVFTDEQAEPSFELPDDWLDLPVAGVSVFDARDYAEWAGKRLPTAFEWQRAAGGDDSWPLPWDAALLSTEEIEAVAVVGRANTDWLPKRSGYLGGVVPVTLDTRDVTPTGLKHMLGNVSEWTETTPIEGYRDRPLIVPTQHVVGGRAWHAPGVHGDVNHLLGTSPYHSNSVGIRCVRGSPQPTGP